MKLIISTIIASSLCSSLSYGYSNPNRVPLVSIESESYPGQNYSMGFDLDSQGKRVGIFYLDPTQETDKQYKDFSFQALANPQALVTAQAFGNTLNVVEITYVSSVITILYQQNALKGRWSTKKFGVECEGSDSNCVARDLDTGKTTTSIYLTKHTTFGKTVGVDSIEVR